MTWALLALLAAACGEPLPEAGGAPDRAAAGAVGAGSNRNVLLITVDTLRADRLGVYGHPGGATPVLDSLAAEGVTFAAAYSPVPLTLPAHTSLMTGTYPMHHGVRDNVAYEVPEEVETLAEALGAAGYRTGATVSSFVLDAYWGIDQGFQSYVDDFDFEGRGRFSVGGGQSELERTADETVDRALAWLGESDASPFFLWVHLFDPHAPYEPPEPYRSRYAERPYLGEIAFTDAQIGRLLEGLDARGVRADTVVVVAGDHGEGLGEHGEVQHGLFIYEETIRIPFILSAPAAPERGVVREEPVSLVDVAPTILELVGAPALADAQGESLAGLLTAEAPRLDRRVYAESLYGRLHYGWSELRALVGERYKLVESSDPELFDLRADPEEEDNRAGELNSVYLDLHGRLIDLEARWGQAGHDAGTGAVDAETRARLQALGYVGSVRTAPDDEAELPSPRSRIDAYNRSLAARSALNAGALPEAERLLTRVVAEDPGMLEAQRMLGELYTRQGRHGEAAAVYRQAVALSPSDPESHLLLADALSAAGDPAAAVRALEASSEFVDGSTADIQVTLGATRAQLGDLSAAATAFAEALRLDPDAQHAHSGLAQVQFAIGHFEGARSHARAALALDPSMPRAHFVLAEVARREGDMEAAIRAYRAELDNQPTNLLARFNLAMAYRANGNPRDELATLDEVVRLAPEFAPGNLMMARALLEQDTRLREAAGLVERALEVPIADQERLIGYTLMADITERLGDAEAAARWDRLRGELEGRLSGDLQS